MSKPSTDKPTATAQPSPGIINWRTFDPSCLPDGDQSTLAVELVTYRDRLDELLEHEGQYVVIKGQLVLGYYRDRRAALAAAHADFGTVPVLIKQVVEFEPVRRVGNIKI